MSRKVFTAGEVLAAADVNSFLMDQTVMSFAGTAARGSAIPTPVEGMYTHLEDTDNLQFWNGSAWVAPAGMTHLRTTSFTGQSSVNIDNVFTSAFANYKMILTIDNCSINGAGWGMRVRTGGVTNTSANYAWGQLTIGALASLNFANTNNLTSTYIDFGGMNSTAGGNCDVNIFKPQLTEFTGFTSVAGGNLFTSTGGCMTVNTSYDGLAVFPTSGTFTGTARIYGLRNA
jgi:hypothetical protein